MDIEQVRAAKLEMEKHLLELFKTFEQSTGMEIDQIDWQRSNALGHRNELGNITTVVFLK